MDSPQKKYVVTPHANYVLLCIPRKKNTEEEKDLRYYGAYLLDYSHRELDEFFESCEETA